MIDLEAMTLDQLRDALRNLLTPNVPPVDTLEGATIKTLAAEIDRRLSQRKRSDSARP